MTFFVTNRVIGPITARFYDGSINVMGEDREIHWFRNHEGKILEYDELSLDDQTTVTMKRLSGENFW